MRLRRPSRMYQWRISDWVAASTGGSGFWDVLVMVSHGLVVLDDGRGRQCHSTLEVMMWKRSIDNASGVMVCQSIAAGGIIQSYIS